ncbi:MAG TPA: 16S rRNA (cytidine(1402)-2'-O)-methyltransferase [Gemmatimonadaceae bacterium]|nr:16S rRNA (cytidine(1402)-2'-O)-methyltransferase [Gemmatimonadaceae bacterium]
MVTSPSGRLYVVSTPIGNLGDLSGRAVDVLRSVDAVLAEDTRHSRHLLDHYRIDTPLVSHHEHNEARETPRILERLSAGESFALVSDAGTPLVSDPGARLVRAALNAGIAVVPVPGASALLAALVASGLDAERFTFFGFLPRKGRERTEAIDALEALAHTAVLYEAPGRVSDTLAELERHGAGEREVAVARELTKQFEETRRGTVAELARYYADAPPKGEVVIVLAGRVPSSPDEGAARERARVLRQGGASARDVARALVEEHGIARNAAYRLAHEPE